MQFKGLAPPVILKVFSNKVSTNSYTFLGAVGENITEKMLKILDLYEPAGEDEFNAYNVTITDEMNPDDVVQKILEIVEEKLLK